ncbi:PREDICTED: F-box/WD repeat-containing protein sel-10-like [Amphimedon queenslandica]|uniref:F-box domain-containing protein n=1 Tax=Amphimedon queenslandica TaxID=400682 RepID=A0A1X7V5T5_AMPQE|nr:PREDICTED: F-box/WD repeat-containing protein sel-10-like [Amphimedon queenslandica]|eukprot:XP_019850695.1 PREDICTED: F-box/WD repeat-containing protein sel-10-like [Amphimedon queenslandica]
MSLSSKLLEEVEKLSQNEVLSLQLELLKRTNVQNLRLLREKVHELLSFDLISDLPITLALNILSYLDAFSLCTISQCCSRYRELANDNLLWHRLCISKGYTQYQSLSFPESEEDCHPSSPRFKVQKIMKHTHFSYWKVVYMKSTVLMQNWSQGLYSVSALNAGNKEPITAMSLKNDVLVTGSRDGSSKIWNLKSLSVTTTLKGHTDEITTIIVTEGTILSGCSDGLVRCFSLISGQLMWSVEVKKGGIEGMEYASPYLASATSDQSIYVWKTEKGSAPIAMDTLQGHTKPITCLLVNEQCVYSGSWDGTIRIWSIGPTSTNTHVLPAHLEGVMCILILNNSTLASGGGDSVVKIWEPVTGQLLLSLKGHNQEILCLQADDTVLASSSADSTIRIWNADKGHCVHVLENHIGLVRCLLLRGNYLISGGDRKRINVWNKETGKLLHTVHRQQNLIRLLETSQNQIITASPNEGTMGIISYW